MYEKNKVNIHINILKYTGRKSGNMRYCSFDEKSKHLTASILKQLVINKYSKENSPKVRLDTPTLGGKVLNEATSRAIVQAKVDKNKRHDKNRLTERKRRLKHL